MVIIVVILFVCLFGGFKKKKMKPRSGQMHMFLI